MGHGHLELQVVKKDMTFKYVEIVYAVEAFVCSECGLEEGTK